MRPAAMMTVTLLLLVRISLLSFLMFPLLRLLYHQDVMVMSYVVVVPFVSSVGCLPGPGRCCGK